MIQVNTCSLQVGFLSGICIPCYELLSKLIPGTKPLLDGCKQNLETWKNIASVKTTKSKEEEEEGEETDTGIEEVNDEEGEETVEEIDDDCIDNKEV